MSERIMFIGKWATLEFKPEDLWIGLFFRRQTKGMEIWVCLVPCFPIHFHLGEIHGH